MPLREYNEEVSEAEQNNLDSIVQHCNDTLKSLEALINKYEALSRSVGFNWDNVKFAQEDLDNIRAQVAGCYHRLTNFNLLLLRYAYNLESSLNQMLRDMRSSNVQLHKKLDRIMKEKKREEKSGSVVSLEKVQAAAAGDENILQEVEQELLDEGITQETLRRNRHEIISCLLERLTEGTREVGANQDSDTDGDELPSSTASVGGAVPESPEDIDDGAEACPPPVPRPDMSIVEQLNLLTLDCDHVDTYFASLKAPLNISEIARAIPSAELRGTMHHNFEETQRLHGVEHSQTLFALQELADYGLCREEYILAKEWYEELVKRCKDDTRPSWQLAYCKSLCCLGHILALGDFQDGSSTAFEDAASVSTTLSLRNNDCQPFCLWASRSRCRMLLRNGDLADAIAALETPFLKIKSPSSRSG